MGSVFKRTRIHKDGKEADYWYIAYSINGKRKWEATRMIEAGVNIVAVSKILGHADIRTTMRYSHPEDSLKEAVERLANFNSVVSQSVSQQEGE